MPPIFGARTRWKARPTWKFRYDFAVARPPLRLSQPITTSTVTYVSESPLLGFITIYAPYHFTHVHWTDDDGTRYTLSRSDLVTAYDILITHWEDLWRIVDRLDRLYNLAGPEHGRERVASASDDLAEATGHIYSLAIGYGTFLDFLADDETAHVIPGPWRKYKGTLDRVALAERGLTFADRVLGSVSDFFLRVTLLLLRGEWPLSPDNYPELHDLVIEGHEAGRELAEQIGVEWESVTISV